MTGLRARAAATGRMRLMLAGLAAGVVMMVGVMPAAWAAKPVQFAGGDAGNAFVADCGSFEVWDEFEANWRGIERYDRDGNLTSVVERFWGVDRLYNPANGKSFSGSFTQSETVDLVKGQVALNGSIFRITVPGAGAVFLDIGRLVIDFDTGLVFQAGRHQFIDGDLAGLCAVLA